MKTKFSDMVMGAVFTDECDDPDFDQAMYKASDTEAVNVETGNREKINPEAEYTTTGDVVRVYDHPTEIERAALTLLSLSRINHPVLASWIEALIQDPTETRLLSQFYFESGIDAGDYVVPGYYGDRSNDLVDSILELRPLGRKAETPDERAIYQHEANALILAFAVQDYRERGRADGDHTSVINGMGGPLLTVKTSLPAAVVEYTQRQMTVALNALEREQETAKPKRQINIRGGELLYRQIARLGEKLGLNQNEVVTLAVDRMYQREIG